MQWNVVCVHSDAVRGIPSEPVATGGDPACTDSQHAADGQRKACRSPVEGDGRIARDVGTAGTLHKHDLLIDAVDIDLRTKW